MNNYSYDYPIKEKALDNDFASNSNESYPLHDCKYSRTCYEANCFDCGMYNDI